MKTGETYSLITKGQKKWAANQGFNPEKTGDGESSTHDLGSNIFGKHLFSKTQYEFEKGEGKETNQKMRVLWSSSALVVNVFDYWRKEDRIRDIAKLFDPATSVDTMEYEKKCPIQRYGTPPHLDIVFSGNNSKTIAVESKFTEPYRPAGNNLNKYFSNASVWSGLDGLKEYTRRFVETEIKQTAFFYLGVPQLIKHILGLNNQDKKRNGFILYYLWYDFDSPEAEEHQGEIQKFTAAVTPEIDFRSMTYRELFKRITGIPTVDIKYTAYLRERYF